MPTVLRERGFRIYFDSHEPNEPAHVHVDKAGASAKFWLDPIALARTSGFGAGDLSESLRLMRQRRASLLRAWNSHFPPNG